MSAVVQAREKDSRYLATTEPALLRGFDVFTRAPGGVPKLRALILEFALQGRLVRQDGSDEPASLMVHRAQAARGLPTGKRSTRSMGMSDAYGAPLPVGWCWTSLGEVGQISPRNEATDDTAATFVQMSSVPVAMMERHKAEERQWRDIKSGFTHFAEGDVGLAKITPCFENGKSTVFRDLANGIGAGTTELHVVRPLGGLLPEYVLIFLKSPGFRRNGEAVMTGSAGQKRVPRTYFESTPFPVPPLAEQHRIVARVRELMKHCDALEQSGRLADEQHARLTSTLFDALATSESAHALAENWQRVAEHFDLLLDRVESIDALERAILQLAARGLLVPQVPLDESAQNLLSRVAAGRDQLNPRFSAAGIGAAEEVPEDERPFNVPKGWLWARIGAFSEVQGGIQKTQLRRPVKNHFPYLRVANVQRDRLCLDRIERYELTDEEVTRWALQAGDLLVVEGNGSADEIGRCAIWDGSIAPCVFQNHLMRVRPDIPETVEFLKMFLNSPDGMAEMKRLAITTSGLFNLSVGKIRNIAVPLPPLAEQRRIVARVEELRRFCADLRLLLTDARAVQSRLADALITQVT